jgi:hypothetical protein
VAHDPQDPYERFQDGSTTPFLDLIVDVLSMASVAGGSLAILLAIGYLSQSEGRSRGWPFVAIVGVLIAANVVLRVIRARRR